MVQEINLMKYSMLLLLSIAILTSCATTKQNTWLSEHNDTLAKTNQKGISSDEKLDILMTSYALMMHQSLDFLNPEKGITFAEKYNEQHKDLIIDILEEVNDNYSTLSKSQKIAKGIGLMGKPYTGDFVELFPRFQKKYKFLNSFTDVNKRIKEAVLEKLGL